MDGLSREGITVGGLIPPRSGVPNGVWVGFVPWGHGRLSSISATQQGSPAQVCLNHQTCKCSSHSPPGEGASHQGKPRHPGGAGGADTASCLAASGACQQVSCLHFSLVTPVGFGNLLHGGGLRWPCTKSSLCPGAQRTWLGLVMSCCDGTLFVHCILLLQQLLYPQNRVSLSWLVQWCDDTQNIAS